VVERAAVIDYLLEDSQRVGQLVQLSIGCVILPEEHRALPSNVKIDVSDPRFPWTRYVLGKIDVWDRQEERWIVKNGEMMNDRNH
jgi:hypothetical protein